MWSVSLALLITVCVGVNGKNCNIMDLNRCLGQVKDFENGFLFHVVDEEQLRENCKSTVSAVTCANDFASRCMERAEKEVFKVTTGGKIKLVQELCTDGTEINKGYRENFDCWKKIYNDTVFCNEQFEKSQAVLMTEDLIESLRMFHSCCGFEWHKQCKIRAAEVKCNVQARDMVDSVSTLLGGRVLSQLCGPSIPTCHGLYGVEDDDLVARYEHQSNGAAGVTAGMLFGLLYAAVMFVK